MKTTTQVFNSTFRVDALLANQAVKPLVEEYLADQNCWPALWISDKEFAHLSEDDKAAFVYQCTSSPLYTK